MEETPYISQRTLQLPAPVSCLTHGSSNHFLAGSDDGSVRVYNQETLRVAKAIRGLEDVSSIVCMPHSTGGLGDIWIASDRHALRFTMDTEKMILAKDDATLTLELGTDDDDVVNELSRNQKCSQLAFCLDSGTVGVVDLSTKQVTCMRTSHGNICGTVKFIPDRPSELVSGGYDSSLLHHDFHQRTILSRFDLGRTSPPSSGVSMSPPFILSSAVSSSGVFAAGIADGRVWIGIGGEKMSGVPAGASVKKKRRKWEGLKQDEGFMVDVGHGPIAALTFIGPRALLTSTLLGSVTLHEIGASAVGGKLNMVAKWTKATTAVNKVNALLATGDLIMIGGLKASGGGIIEIWEKEMS
ncbi:hypothetical protein M405DRAFT_742533 [Rhizopogon salebrosus TDB-379]|nr:hypothetical protein M405DRAFT_742533 [Rhizopogon salebrosus TDB-379]